LPTRSIEAPIERGQLPLELGHTPSHAEADFMVGEGNKLAYAHLTAFPNWPGPLTLITGPASSGKSHLARIWSERAGALGAPPGEHEALAQAGGQTPVLVEDVDRLDYDEAALFHLLNQSMRDRRPLVLTARQPIANWPYRTDDLKSRARLATHVALAATDDVELSQIFVKLFGDRQIAVDPKIIGYIVPRMERSPEEAVVLAEMMDRLALARGTAINRAIAADALAQRYAQRGGEGRQHPEEIEDDE
jgi:chromosomal replication initiation ATPase DnaA